MKRTYGLFEKHDGRYVRVYENIEGPKAYMVKVCQDLLLAYFFGRADYPRELRPLKKAR